MSNAKPPKTITTEDQQSLLDALLRKNGPSKSSKKGVRNYLMACLMLDAGLRVGEVVKLRNSHLYFNALPVKTLVLSGTMTKNHKERTVPIGIRLADSLHSFFRTWLLTDLIDENAYCFYTSDPEHPLSTRQVENIINTAALKVFGRPINPHMLRHTFASRLMRVTNIRTVQELLGHKYVTSTQIYTHPNEDDKKSAIEDLENETKELGKDLESLAGHGG